MELCISFLAAGITLRTNQHRRCSEGLSDAGIFLAVQESADIEICSIFIATTSRAILSTIRPQLHQASKRRLSVSNWSTTTATQHKMHRLSAPLLENVQGIYRLCTNVYYV